MASIFGHSLVAVSAYVSLPKRYRSKSLLALGIVSACLPDMDVLGFFAGIPYGHIWGHRGMTHSITFGVIWSLMVYMIYSRCAAEKSIFIWVYLMVCIVSHGLIDACTSGGHGIALLAPWDNQRIFFDYRPILVSPLGVSRFFSKWGLEVLASEAYWIGIPCLGWVITTFGLRRYLPTR